MRSTKKALALITVQNKEYAAENTRLREKCGELEKNERELHDATAKINEMMIESQAASETIQ